MRYDARGIGAASRIGLLALLALAASGCATTYAPDRLTTPDELRDVKTRSIGDVSVSVSILTDEQARRHFGVDLARHDVQALWMSVRNGSERRLWFIRNMLDPDFYAAAEVALLVQDEVPGDARAQPAQSLRDESIRSQLAPRTVTEGFMFLPRVEGGRYVDIRLQGDAYQEDGQKHDAIANAGTSAARSPPAAGAGPRRRRRYRNRSRACRATTGRSPRDRRRTHQRRKR